MIPQELLIIKSLISPDSAESILLSNLISIRIMPPVSQSFQFRGQGVGIISNNLAAKLETNQFFVEATVIIREMQYTGKQTWSLNELLIGEYWMGGTGSWGTISASLIHHQRTDSQPPCTSPSWVSRLQGCGWVGRGLSWQCRPRFLQHRAGLSGTTRTQWIMSSLCDVCCRG